MIKKGGLKPERERVLQSGDILQQNATCDRKRLELVCIILFWRVGQKSYIHVTRGGKKTLRTHFIWCSNIYHNWYPKERQTHPYHGSNIISSSYFNSLLALFPVTMLPLSAHLAPVHWQDTHAAVCWCAPIARDTRIRPTNEASNKATGGVVEHPLLQRRHQWQKTANWEHWGWGGDSKGL